MNTDNLAGLLVGVALALGFIPLLIASFLIRENLFLIILDQMDQYWKTRAEKRKT